MANKILFLFVFLSLSVVFVYSQQEGDRILAIVGNDIITESDLNEQLIVFMRQYRLTQYNQMVVAQVFNNMITEKLILAKAEQDSLTAPEEDIQKQLDYKVRSLVEEFGSEKNLEQQYGMTMAKIKQILKDDIKKQILVDKEKQNKFSSGVKVTDSEVRNFFYTFRDSLPAMPETYELYRISISPKMTAEEKNNAYFKAKSILDSIRMGTDFSEMAVKYSDDSASAIRGGDLGKVKRGVFVKEFEDAAFLLKPGEVSDIVETQFGYHIIKLISKSGDLIETKHILIKFPKTQSADFEAIRQLKDIKEKALSGEKSFRELAALYSQDKNALRDSGYIGKVSLSDQNFDSLEIVTLKSLNIGDVSDPVREGDNENYSYVIYRVKDKIPEHKLALDTDYKVIENDAQNYKERKEMNDWLDEIRKSIYVDIKYN